MKHPNLNRSHLWIALLCTLWIVNTNLANLIIPIWAQTIISVIVVAMLVIYIKSVVDCYIAQITTRFNDDINTAKADVINKISNTESLILDSNNTSAKAISDEISKNGEYVQSIISKSIESGFADLKTDVVNLRNSTKEHLSNVEVQIGRSIDTATKSTADIKEYISSGNLAVLNSVQSFKEAANNSLDKLSTSINKETDTINTKMEALDCATSKIDGNVDRVASLLKDSTSDLKENIYDYRTLVSEQFATLTNSVGKSSEIIEKGLKSIKLDTDSLSALLKEQLLAIRQLELKYKIISDNRDTTDGESHSNSDTTSIKSVVDDKTNNIVDIYYEGGKVVKAITKRPNGAIIFKSEYSNEQIVKSQNIDEYGNVVLELTYHSNGEVKCRKERIVEGGKIKVECTEFDTKGLKIK